MKTHNTHALRATFVLLATLFAVSPRNAAVAGEDAYTAFENEEITPYIKVMKGPWASNIITGADGDYGITSILPAASEFIVGVFDRKIGRKGKEERCAVVLVDGVNPLDPSERVDIEEAATSDVRNFKKYALNGLSFNATDNSGKQCCVIIVDAKEEFEFGDVKPFKIPENRSGRVLGRVHVFVYAGPAMPPKPGQIVRYGRPLDKFAFTLQRKE